MQISNLLYQLYLKLIMYLYHLFMHIVFINKDYSNVGKPNNFVNDFELILYFDFVVAKPLVLSKSPNFVNSTTINN